MLHSSFPISVKHQGLLKDKSVAARQKFPFSSGVP